MLICLYRLALEAKSKLYERMANAGDNAEDEDGNAYTISYWYSKMWNYVEVLRRQIL